MRKSQTIITENIRKVALDAINLVKASLESMTPYEAKKKYTPKEQEPYDALCDRFVRAVEVGIQFFRSYEKLMYGINSDTIRDLLNRIQKADLISSVILWMDMRDVRNRLVLAYSPEKIQAVYAVIMGEFGKELLQLQAKLVTISLQKEGTL